jgi:histidine ammonia-lyase
MNHAAQASVVFGSEDLAIDDIVAVAKGASAVLSDDSAASRRVQLSACFLDRLLSEEGVVYGVTTGYGDSCTVAVPRHLVDELPLHLIRFHGCGLGADLAPEQVRAVLATRLCSLALGYSGVRRTLLEQIIILLQHNVLPRIPQEGSVGASGDLTPLSYVAAVLTGDREVMHQNRIRPTADVFNELHIAPLTMKPKEALAVMNGTSVMTALACLAFTRSAYLARLATRITAMVSAAMHGNGFHFDESLFALKPHPGQQQIAAWLRADLQSEHPPRNSNRLQDRYSLRCAPHVIGVLQDSLPWLRSFIEGELNSANDNPLVDGENERILHGGHFYGGHIAMAMDTLKTAVANVADLLDRQLAQVVDARYNNGLPANLTGSEPERIPLNHGFKAVQIAVSAWTAEALKLTMPASVFSRSTECHNQDKVSMGTISARDALRVLELTEQVSAAGLLAATQALHLRRRNGKQDEPHLAASVHTMLTEIESWFTPLTEDRPLEADLRQTVNRIQQQHWELY